MGCDRGSFGDNASTAGVAPVCVLLAILGLLTACATGSLEGGEAGARGRNRVERTTGGEEELGSRATLDLDAGDRLWIETPGGGGFGAP